MSTDDKVVSIARPTGELHTISQVGGDFDETRLWLIVNSVDLDREGVTELLGVEPSKAWNAGEPHFQGEAKRRLVTKDFGQWMLYTDLDSSPITDKIRLVLGQCTQDLESWRRVTESHHCWLSIGGHLNNWNRELILPVEILTMITERQLALSVDVYFDGDELDAR